MKNGKRIKFPESQYVNSNPGTMQWINFYQIKQGFVLIHYNQNNNI